MLKHNKKKYFYLFFIVIISFLFLTACENGRGFNNRGEGYIEGYLYETEEGDYVFEKSENAYAVKGAKIKIDNQVYTTTKEGYFKSSSLYAGQNYSVNIIIEKENESDFAWTKSFKLRDGQILNLSSFSLQKEWNMVLFLVDKEPSGSLDENIQRYLASFDGINNMDNLNLFIIHGSYLDDKETNKAYYVTGNEKREIFDYGEKNMADPQFYREELVKIQNNYPADKLMVTISSHGNGWIYRGDPGIAKNFLAEDKAYYERMSEEGFEAGEINNVLNSFDIYDMFYNIGFDIDIFNLTPCHSGQIEVISDLPESVKYVIASPGYSYTADMRTHNRLFRDINNGNFNSVEALAKKYIDIYIDQLNGHSDDYPSVKALYKIDKVSDFVEEFRILSEKLYQLSEDENNLYIIEKFFDDIIDSNQIIQSYYAPGSGIVEPDKVYNKDLIALLEYFVENNSIYGEDIADQAAATKNILKDIVLYSNFSQGYETEGYSEGVDLEQEKYTYKNSNGISINVGDNWYYQDTWFNQKTDWYQFIDLVRSENKKIENKFN